MPESVEGPGAPRDAAETVAASAVGIALLGLIDAVEEAADADAAARVVVDGLPALVSASTAVLWFGEEAAPPSGRGPHGALGPDDVDRVHGLLTGGEPAGGGHTGRGAVIAVDGAGPAAPALRTLLGLPAHTVDAPQLRAVPIVFADTLLGALVLARPGGAPCDDGGSALLAPVARALGRVAARLREQAQRARSEAQQREEIERLRATVAERDDLGTIVRSIADAVNVAVMFYDTENRPRLHNRMVEKVLGLTGYDPATGMSTHVYASDRRTPVKRDKDIVSETIEGDQRGVIYWVGDPDGDEQRAVITEAHRITRPDGVPLGSAVVTYDVTDLANAIEMREDYLTTVSHELRTPLTSIVGYLDLVADTHDLAELGIEEEFRVIQRNADQLVTLVHDLASTDAREQRLRVEPVDLTALVSESVDTLRPAIERAGHALRLDLPPSSLSGRADAARIAQVLDNLVSNAVKYTPAGGTVGVSLTQEGEDAVIRVSDTGRGIGRGDQARVFERFFRAEDVRAAAIQGVGVGLTIAKNIVDAHGGTITVASEPGRGSTFVVRLPLRPRGAPLSALSDRL